MPPVVSYYAYVKIPYYVAYRCSKCNKVNVFTGYVYKQEKYAYFNFEVDKYIEKEEALNKAREKAEKEAAELTVPENAKEVLEFPYFTCNNCKHREPWSDTKTGCFYPIVLGAPLLFLPFFLIALLALLFFGNLFLLLPLAIIAVLYFGFLTMRSRQEKIETQKFTKLDDLNMPHVALDKEGLIECLKIVDPQNEYGNLDDFENTLYAEREEGFKRF